MNDMNNIIGPIKTSEELFAAIQIMNYCEQIKQENKDGQKSRNK